MEILLEVVYILDLLQLGMDCLVLIITSVSNGQNIVVTFDYKIVNYSSATVATPAGWGNLQVQMSQDNGATWTTQFTIKILII